MYRQLIDYLPPVIINVEEYKAIMAAEQPCVETAWDCANEALNNQFISDLSLYGVKRWEKILNIVPSPTSSIETRKTDILSILLSQLPFTMKKLEEIMNSVVGKENYELNLQNKTYTLTVRLSDDGYTHLNAIKNTLEAVLPANLIYAFVSFIRKKAAASVYSNLSHRHTVRISPYRRV